MDGSREVPIATKWSMFRFDGQRDWRYKKSIGPAFLSMPNRQAVRHPELP